jgi:hypothetical protein
MPARLQDFLLIYKQKARTRIKNLTTQNIRTHTTDMKLLRKIKTFIKKFATNKGEQTNPAKKTMPTNAVVTASTPSACHWDKLSTELQLQILNNFVTLRRPIGLSPSTAPIHTKRLIPSGAGIVNRRMNILVTDTFYKNNTFVVRYAQDHTSKKFLCTPPRAFGHMIRHLELHLSLDMHQSLKSFKQLLYSVSDWQWYLTPDADIAPPQPLPYHCHCGYSESQPFATWSPQSTSWQDHYPNLASLKVVIKAWRGNVCLLNRHLMDPVQRPEKKVCLAPGERDEGEGLKEWFKKRLVGTHVKIGARKVEVEVLNMNCEGYLKNCEGLCADVVATVIREMIPVLPGKDD